MVDKEKEFIQLKRQVELQNKKLQHIFKIGRASVAILSSQKPEKLNSVLQAIINEATEILDSEVGSILFFNEKLDIMTIRVAKGLDGDIIKKTRLKTGERISGWVAKHKKGILVKDIEKDPRFSTRSHERYYTKSLISAPIMIDSHVLGVININNKRNRQVFNEEDLDLLEAVAAQAALIISNVKLYKQLQKLYMNTVEALAEAIDARDHYTKSHSEHVTEYAIAIAKEMGLSQHKIEIVERASKLHDVGKIGIHDYILTKPGKLTKEEWEEVKTHSLKGARILEPLAFLDGVIGTIKQHHERYDGSGYPDKIKGDKIRIEARIMAVADSFDAMVTERPYAAIKTREEAIEELKKESGKQFDPKVVEAFLRVLEKRGK